MPDLHPSKMQAVVARLEADLAETCPPHTKYTNALVGKADLRALLASHKAMEEKHDAEIREALREVAKWFGAARYARGLLGPVDMQHVRLAVGEGKLRPQDVLTGCNAEIGRRAALVSPAGGGDG